MKLKKLLYILLVIGVLLGTYRFLRLNIFKELNCKVSDNAAEEIADDFCRYFDISCVGDPVVKYFDSTGLKITPPFYRKAVSYDNNGISINCDNSQVIKYKEFHDSEVATEVSIKSGYDQFKSMLAYSGIADCAFIISSEMAEDGNIKYIMNSYDDAGNLLNYGQFVINASTGQIYLYSVEMANWCNEKDLPVKYRSFISLLDAKEIAESYIKEYELKNYAISKISLIDKSHGLSEQAWDIILSNEKNEVTDKKKAKRFKLVNIKKNSIDIKREINQLKPDYIQIVINSVTGKEM